MGRYEVRDECGRVMSAHDEPECADEAGRAWPHRYYVTDTETGKDATDYCRQRWYAAAHAYGVKHYRARQVSRAR